MSLYTTTKNSQYQTSYYLGLSLNHLSEQVGMTLFSLRNVRLGSSETVFNPDGNTIADVVEITLRSSTIGSTTVDLQFFYDPYDWSFPPDLIINGLPLTPSLRELGLDDSWDHEDPANLSRVLGRLARIMQHGERQRVALCDNERIQVEYSCLHDMEEMDCSLIPGFDGPTKVVFAVPFYVSYMKNGRKQKTKIVAKIQFMISSLVQNDIMNVQSKIEALSAFEFPDLLQSIPEISKQEPIIAFIERISKRVTDHFERSDRIKQLKKEFIQELCRTFRDHLLECDIKNNTFASFLLAVPKDKARPEPLSTAIATFTVSDRFPDELPKLILTAPMMPSNSFLSPPPPETVLIKRYSPRWSADRMVTEIWEQLWDDIPRFHAKMTQTVLQMD